MAAFACFSSYNEQTSNYKDLIQRLKENSEKLEVNLPSIPNPIFAYYSPQKDRFTHVYKDFIYQLRKTEFEEINIILCDNPSIQLKNIVRYIEETKLCDGLYACNYYGDIKKIVTSFMNYFTQIIDNIVRKIDDYSHNLSNDLLLTLIDNTMEMHKQSQEAFLKEFLPINSPAEQKLCDEIVEKCAIYMKQLRHLRKAWVGCRHDQLEDFAKEYFEPSLKRTNELCTFTHTFISMMLAERCFEIATSIEENLDRMETNSRAYKDQCHIYTQSLIQDLYEKNKESLLINRREIQRYTDIAEIYKAIDVIKEKIEHYGNDETTARLALETHHWMKKLIEFNDIAGTVLKLRTEVKKIIKEEATYRRLRTTELPGSKTLCFELIGENFTEKKLFLEEKIVEVSKAFVTFFCVRGTNRILYTDTIGSYYCDEYNHQNYINEYGLKYFHVNCNGEFLENLESDPHYFDGDGRYINVEQQKIHQCAPCTSHYILGADGLFKKISKDCGHSEEYKENCRVQIKDLTDVVLLPKRDIIDITGTLDGSATKYLWDNFGMILPEVLMTVAMEKPKNPIHYMSHILLKRRFEATQADLQRGREQAAEYRAKIYKERKDKTNAVTRKWKSKLVKRRKPEESDDSQEWAVYNQHVANLQSINSLGYYN